MRKTYQMLNGIHQLLDGIKQCKRQQAGAQHHQYMQQEQSPVTANDETQHFPQIAEQTFQTFFLGHEKFFFKLMRRVFIFVVLLQPQKMPHSSSGLGYQILILRTAGSNPACGTEPGVSPAFFVRYRHPQPSRPCRQVSAM